MATLTNLSDIRKLAQGTCCETGCDHEVYAFGHCYDHFDANDDHCGHHTHLSETCVECEVCPRSLGMAWAA
jgi:hypothetical protein